MFDTKWIHAFEEDTGKGDVYRPETDDIPLSRRPRQRLMLRSDGSALVWLPGADDRPVEKGATWRREGDGFVVTRKSDAGGADEWRVSVTSPTRLLVKSSRT